MITLCDAEPMTVRKKTVLALAFLILLTALVHGSALSGWWRWDDPDHLAYAMAYSPRAYFFVPEVWQRISPVNFTPLLSLSYDVDQRLFGFAPQGFYVHHLVALAAAAAMTFLLLSLWLPGRFALLGSVLFLLGTPTLIVAQQLMTRHYIEGLALAAAALGLFVLSLRKKRSAYGWLGALCYLLAMLAKEVYAPLVGLLWFIPEGRFRERLQRSVPFLLAALLYILWRVYMLTVPVSGYSSFAAFDVVSSLRQFANIPLLLLQNNSWGILAWTLLAAGVLFALIRRPRSSAVTLVALGLLLLPLLPLTVWPGLGAPDRFLFLVWWAISVATAWTVSNVIGESWWRIAAAIAIAAAMLGATLLQAHLAAGNLKGGIAEKEAYSRFVWEAEPTGILVLPPEIAASFWDFSQLSALRMRLLNQQAPTVVTDELQLAAVDLEGRSVWTYEATCRCMRDISAEIPARLQAWRNRQAQHPLEIAGRRGENVFFWKFGPYVDGQYNVIGNAIGKVPLPPQGRLQTPLRPQTMVVRYDSPEGWISYSPPFRVTSSGVEWLAEGKK